MSEEIKVILTADTTQLRAQLTLAENDLKAFQTEIKRATNVQDITKLQNSINILKDKITGLRTSIASSGTSMDALSTRTKGAGLAMTDLSRIVQDAPYGFMAISNNLNPMLESFQRLKVESGGTGSALKLMASSLNGPAGIGLALSVVSSAIVYFSTHVSKTKAVIDEVKKANDEFKKSLLDAQAGAMAAGVQLQLFVDIAKNGSLPLSQRNEALKEANKLLGEHGMVLTLDNIASAAATKAVTDYTNALVAQAVAQAYVKRISDATVQKQDLLSQLNTNQKEQIRLSKDLAAQKLLAANQQKEQERNGAGQTDYLTVIQDKLNKKIEEGAAISQKIISTEKTRTDGLIEAGKATLDATNLMAGLGTKTKETSKDIEDINDVLNKLQEDLRDQRALAITFDTSTLKQQADLINTAITDLVTKFNVSPSDSQILKLKAQLAPIDIGIAIEKLIADAAKQQGKDVPLLKLGVEPVMLGEKWQQKLELGPLKKYIIDKKALEDKDLKDTQDYIKQMNSIVSGFAEDMVIAFSTGLGDILSGDAGFGDLFANIFKVVGQGMVTLGKFFIQMGIEIEIAKTALKSHPLLAIAAGIALVAIGTAISNSMKKPAFAVGTRNAPGGMALVGERGPEMINLPRGSSVTPAAQTASMMGGMQSVEVYGMLRGQDIFFSNKKYGQTYNRQT
jgi:hypothetical protein